MRFSCGRIRIEVSDALPDAAKVTAGLCDIHWVTMCRKVLARGKEGSSQERESGKDRAEDPGPGQGGCPPLTAFHALGGETGDPPSCHRRHRHQEEEAGERKGHRRIKGKGSMALRQGERRREEPPQ